jgi:opacity protein-like surface antigen
MATANATYTYKQNTNCQHPESGIFAIVGPMECGSRTRRLKIKSSNHSLSLLLCTCLVSTAAFADNPLGIYIGAGAGKSRVRTDKAILGDYDYVSKFDEGHSAWKVIAGIRPLSPLGVELEYIDFGNPRSGLVFSGLGGLTRVDEKAVTLFGLGYLPLPVPFLDAYGKLGIARLHTTWTGLGPVPYCPVRVTACLQPTFNQSNWSTNLAYGAGVQGKVGRLAVRAEYERIRASGGGPDAFSAGVTWAF